MEDTLTAIAQSVGILRDVVVISFFVCVALVAYRKMLNPQRFGKLFDGAGLLDTMKAFRQEPNVSTTSRVNAMCKPDMEDCLFRMDDGDVLHNTLKRHGITCLDSSASVDTHAPTHKELDQKKRCTKPAQHVGFEDLLASMNASTKHFNNLLSSGLGDNHDRENKKT